MKYKILFINLFPEIGGAETSLLYLIKALDNKKFTPILLVPKRGLLSERLKKYCKIYYLPLPAYSIKTFFVPGFDIIAAYKFYKLCQKIKPDLIHLNHLTLSFYTGVVKHLLHIPVVGRSWMNTDIVYFFQNIFSDFGTNIIAPINQEIHNQILAKAFISDTKIKTLMPGIDCNYFQPTKNKYRAKRYFGVKSENFIITYVSRFDPIKDHVTFLRAMKIVADKIRNLTIIIGQNPKINLDKEYNTAPLIKKNVDLFLTENPQLAKKIFFCGYKKNMVPVYQATDILVSSSLYESLGLCLIEGSACGLPIVSTNGGTENEVIAENKSGFLVPVKNYELLAEKILILYKNHNLRINFGKNARKIAEKKFSLKRYIAEISIAYLDLIHHHGNSH